jgi:hypothetical protein
MTNGNQFTVFVGYSGPTPVLRVDLRRSSGLYQVRLLSRKDSTTWAGGSWITISDAAHSLEILWRASSAPGANNGVLAFWIDGLRRSNLTTVDNDTRKLDTVRLGAVLGLDAGTRGSIFFDAFESRRQTYIGR